MSYANTHRFKAGQARKAERRSKEGYRFEEEMCGILDKMQKEGLISSFCRFDHYSEEDLSGKDFLVAKVVDGKKEVYCAFGVTISLKRWQETKMRHRDVPQLCFPLGTKVETIQRRVLELPYS